MSTNSYLQDDTLEACNNRPNRTRRSHPWIPSNWLGNITVDQSNDYLSTDSTQEKGEEKIASPLEPPSETESEPEDDTPVELQLEKVDMENEDMDMLEWTVRKIIPIPKQYYWETGNDDLPLRIKAWHQAVGSMSATIKWIDRIGKPIVDASGLKSSRFEYVRETMTEEQIQESIEKVRQRKSCSRRIKNFEENV